MNRVQRASEELDDEADRVAAVLGIGIPPGELGETVRRHIETTIAVLLYWVEITVRGSRL